MLIPKTPRKFALAKAPENKKDKITNTFKPQLDNLKTFTKFIVRHPFKDSKL